MKAFDLIKTQAQNGREHVCFETWNRIMRKISTAFGEAKVCIDRNKSSYYEIEMNYFLF